MIYKDFQGEKLSALGMGMMRLPVIDGVYAHIDEAQTAQMIDYALEHGVNYFDTAWGYHDGNSETIVGKLLSSHPRETFHLASKFPGYDPSNFGKVEQIFEAQLQKCQVEYFDFYLLHNIYEKNIDDYLNDEAYNTIPYLLEQKKNGRIKHLGFSCHGEYDVLKRFLDAHADDIEFCQLQINYLDWNFQDAKAKVELLNDLNIPVWVMEPLRGGKLAALPEADAAKLAALRPEETVPGWAFRFLQGITGVTVTLAGSSDFEQLKQNIATYETDEPTTTEEDETLIEIGRGLSAAGTLPCTACRYCTAHCPQELDIPRLIQLYNQLLITGTNDFIAPMAVGALPDDKKPSACIGCGACETVCPQQIAIPDMMEDFSNRLGLK